MKPPNNWKENDSVIACHLVSNGPAKLPDTAIRHCEICKEPVWCSPVTVEKAKLPNFHISCVGCYEAVETEKNFIGHIKAGAKVLPTKETE